MKLLGTPTGTRFMLLLLVTALLYSGFSLVDQDSKAEAPPTQVMSPKEQEFKILAKSYDFDKNLAKPKELDSDQSRSTQDTQVAGAATPSSNSTNTQTDNANSEQPSRKGLLRAVIDDVAGLLGI